MDEVAEKMQNASHSFGPQYHLCFAGTGYYLDDGMELFFKIVDDAGDSVSYTRRIGNAVGKEVHNFSAVINHMPSRLKQFGKCDEFAQNLVDALDQEGIAYKIIRIDSEYGIYSDKAAMSIGQGYHYGVQIGDIVYDNMTPNGIKLNVWLEDLGLTQEFDSISWKYTNKIVNN